MAWFVCDYIVPVRGPHVGSPRARAVAMDRYTTQIHADGGTWREVEVLGNRALVKVRASPATLSTIAADPHCRRLPLAVLDTSLAKLTTAQRNAIRDELAGMGYSLSEIRDRLGKDLARVTLRHVVRVAASRRVTPRWDGVSLVFDGPTRPCESVDALDILVDD